MKKLFALLLITVFVAFVITYLFMLQKNKLKNSELHNHFEEQQSNLAQEIALAAQKEQMLRSDLDKLKTGIPVISKKIGAFLAEASSLLRVRGGSDFFSNLAIFLVASKDARCVGAGGSGINQGLSRNVKGVDAKKKPP
mgnify:CR=1 FL=1